MEYEEKLQVQELNFKSSTRRELLKKALSLSAKMIVANTGVYVIGAAFKELDGSLVAGAKVWTPLIYLGSGLAPHECGDPCATGGAISTCMDCIVGSTSCADRWDAKCQ